MDKKEENVQTNPQNLLNNTHSQILVLNENKFTLKRNVFFDFLTTLKVHFQYFFKTLFLVPKNLKSLRKERKNNKKQKNTAEEEINYKPLIHTVIITNEQENVNDIVNIPSSVYESENNKYDISNQDNAVDAALLAKSFELERSFGFKQNEVKPFEVSESEINELAIIDKKIKEEQETNLALVENKNYLPGTNIFESLVPENNSLIRFVSKSKNKLWWKLLIFFGSIGVVSIVAYVATTSIMRILKDKENYEKTYFYRKEIDNLITDSNRIISNNVEKRDNRDIDAITKLKTAIKIAQLESSKILTWPEYKEIFEKFQQEYTQVINEITEKEKLEIEIRENSIYNLAVLINKFSQYENEGKFTDLVNKVVDLKKYVETRLKNFSTVFTLVDMKNFKIDIDKFYSQHSDLMWARYNDFQTILKYVPHIENKTNIFPSEIFKKYQQKIELFSFTNEQKKFLKDRNITYKIQIDPNDIEGEITFKISYFIEIFGVKVSINSNSGSNFEKIQVVDLKKFDFQNDKRPQLNAKNNYEFNSTNWNEFKNKVIQFTNNENYDLLNSLIKVEHPDPDLKYNLVFDKQSVSSPSSNILKIKYKLASQAVSRYNELREQIEYAPVISKNEYEVNLNYYDFAVLNSKNENFTKSIKDINNRNEEFFKTTSEHLHFVYDADLAQRTFNFYKAKAAEIEDLFTKFGDPLDLEGLNKEIGKLSEAITKEKTEIIQLFENRNNQKDELRKIIKNIETFAENNINRKITNIAKTNEVYDKIATSITILNTPSTDLSVYENKRNELEQYFNEIKTWANYKNSMISNMENELKDFIHWMSSNITDTRNAEFLVDAKALETTFKNGIQLRFGTSPELNAMKKEMEDALREFQEGTNKFKKNIQAKNELKEDFQYQVETFKNSMNAYDYEHDNQKAVYKNIFDEAKIAIGNASIVYKDTKSTTDQLKAAKDIFIAKKVELENAIKKLNDDTKAAALARITELIAQFASLMNEIEKKQNSEDLTNPLDEELDNIKTNIEKPEENFAHLHVKNKALVEQTFNKYKTKLDAKKAIINNLKTLIEQANARYQAIQNIDKYKSLLAGFKSVIDSATAKLNTNIPTSVEEFSVEVANMQNLLVEMNK
ncbi:hypothetical protein ACJA25_02320 [Mycoplasmopsis hyopharyngis]|uniref:hypothetical protein n=1 Tax=Mycoplasmopsis hyopharyngis TaxID=29558 RepID=UPI003873C29D